MTVNTERRQRPSLRAPLRIGGFRRLLSALALSVAGDWLYNVALIVFVFQRTHSAAWVGAATAVRLVPQVAFGAAGGVVADRFERRRVMVVSDVMRALLMVGLALVAWRSGPPALALTIAFLSTTAGTPYVPAVTATVPSMVVEGDLAGANGVSKADGVGARGGAP